MPLLKNPLSALTKDKEEQRNMALLGSRNVLRRASFPLTSGDVVTPLNVATPQPSWSAPFTPSCQRRGWG